MEKKYKSKNKDLQMQEQQLRQEDAGITTTHFFICISIFFLDVVVNYISNVKFSFKVKLKEIVLSFHPSLPLNCFSLLHFYAISI